MGWRRELVELIARMVSRQDSHDARIKAMEGRFAQANSIMFAQDERIKILENK